ncbi:GMP synthase [Reticulomyxa filosa]|uniref:GMP synthase n=1 Tax=Reticulomyxa filosa TaxID=46433 RepID=X6NW27_RETFI|nr:GMP synthase [Reticulomyxa filosa]|eukprot:ETO29472.1 GMP synthase [Reticulomyxa filosa]
MKSHKTQPIILNPKKKWKKRSMIYARTTRIFFSSVSHSLVVPRMSSITFSTESKKHVDEHKISANENKQNTKRKKYACFVAGEPPNVEISKKHGDYGDVVINFLKEESKNEDWLRFDVRKGEFPTENQLQEISGIAITGSCSDAHSEEPWVGELKTNYQSHVLN